MEEEEVDVVVVVVVEVVVQEERQEEGSLVMASLNAIRAWAWACTMAMFSWVEEVAEGMGVTATATARTSAGIAECMMSIRIERRERVHGRPSIS